MMLPHQPVFNTMNIATNDAKKALEVQIQEGIRTRNYCGVFSNQLAPIWPCSSAAIDQQAEAIRVFARERGWTASITKQCLRVTFRKKPNR
jgi:hypothetical protein